MTSKAESAEAQGGGNRIIDKAIRKITKSIASTYLATSRYIFTSITGTLYFQ